MCRVRCHVASTHSCCQVPRRAYLVAKILPDPVPRQRRTYQVPRDMSPLSTLDAPSSASIGCLRPLSSPISSRSRERLHRLRSSSFVLRWPGLRAPVHPGCASVSVWWRQGRQDLSVNWVAAAWIRQDHRRPRRPSNYFLDID